MRTLLRPLRVALSLLTRLPIDAGELTGVDRRRMVMCFPLVGVLIAAPLVATAWAFGRSPVPLSADLVAVGMVAWLALVSGGLHLDGLADWFDGLGGGRGQAARMLEIMRDPHIGAHGAAALCLLLLAKVYAFSAALSVVEPLLWLAVPVVARFSVTPLLVLFPLARDNGLARAMRPEAGMASLAVGLGFTGTLLWWLGPATLTAGACGLAGALLVGWWATSRLGGLTGDVYGAALELSELTVAALLPYVEG